MIASIWLALCVVGAWLQIGGKRKMSLDRSDVQRINRHLDKLHPENGSSFE